MKIPSVIYLLVCTSACALPVEKIVECRLLCLQASKSPVPALVTGPVDAPVRCDLPREEISRPVKLTAVDGKIVFRVESSGDEPAAVATLPSGCDGGLLLFLPTDAGESMPLYRVLVLDDSASSLPRDGSFVYNACPANIRFLIGDQPGMPKPGKIAVVERPKKRDDYQMGGVRFQIQNGDQWRTIYESMIRFPENQHRLFVAYIHPASKLPGLRVLRFTPR